MAPDRQHISITLPRNFTFHYTDGQLPRTPEPQLARDENPPQEPPQLCRQAYRVRRRRPAAPFRKPSPDREPHNIPIPSIETSEVPSVAASLHYHLPDPVEGLLKPSPTIARFFAPPKTPEAQMISDVELFRHITPDWARADSMTWGESISRPSSSGSGLSDSSLDSFPSLAGSCTSPESETSDPFFGAYDFPKMQLPAYVLQDGKLKPRDAHKSCNFTKEMDDHIWKTYLRVLQDPMATPYKTLPGTVPPSGIQSRVARLAKKTWKGPRSVSALRTASGQRPESTLRAGTPDTVKAAKSGSSTPTAMEIRKPYPSWPAEGVTRRRFRMLCRAKPSLSAHYQRLLYRSPSPFPSSPRSVSHSDYQKARSPTVPSDANASFSTRDMHMSLTTSMASSMQLGNPLSQLATGADTLRAANDEWFGQPIARANAHQKSQSLHIELGLGGSSHSASGAVLGSPFNPRRMRKSVIERGLQGPTSDLSPSDGSQEPLQLHAPAPLPRSFKRRAQYNLDDEATFRNEETRKSLLNELFGAPAESSHRRVRSRGFSLGDMGEGARRLTSIFNSPITIDASNNMFSNIPMLSELSSSGPASTTPMTGLASGPTARLASPFGGRSTNGYFSNTFPRNFTPHSFEPAASFEERLSQSDMMSPQ